MCFQDNEKRDEKNIEPETKIQSNFGWCDTIKTRDGEKFLLYAVILF